jgi:hypothetical protein
LKRYVIALALAAALMLPAALTPAASYACEQSVSGYTRSNGTYVNGYSRSCANSTPDDNWSTRGNVNPHTGEWGTRSPSYPSYSPSYPSYGSSSYWP